MKEILIKAIEKYGINNQLDMVVEECAELIQAVNKLKRSGTTYLGELPKTYQGDKYIEAYHNLCSEIADVKIMIKQLEIILNKECIDLCEERKLVRLQKRLNQ